MNRLLRFINAWELIIKYCLYGAVLLMPFLFLPWTVYQASWNKHFLLVLLVFVAFVAWLIKNIIQGKIVYAKGYSNLVAVALVVIVAISAFLSQSRSLGFWGATGAEVSSLLSIATLIVLFFLVRSYGVESEENVATSREKGERLAENLGRLFIIGSAVAFVIGVLQLWGIWVFPWDFTKTATFNTIGTSNALALFFGFVFVRLFATLYGRKPNFSWQNISLIIFAAVLFIALIMMRFWVAFLGIGILVGAVTFTHLWGKKKEEIKMMIVPFLIIAISLFFVVWNFFPFANLRFLPTFEVLPEVMPSVSASWSIAKTTASESLKNFLVGSGPATFQYQYGLYRVPELNATTFWNVRFVQGFNAIMTHLVEWGFLGTFVWLIFLAMVGWQAIKRLSQQPALSGGLLYLIMILFFYPQNFVLYFFLFLLAGLLMNPLLNGETNPEQRYRSIILIDTPIRTFAFSLTMMVIIMLLASLLYIDVQRYLASIYFNQALANYNRTGDVEQAFPRLVTALDLDPRNDLYLQNISQGFLLRLRNLINQGQLPPAELQTQFSNNLGAAIQWARRATEINPRDSQNWFNLGRVYENVILLVPGAADLAFESYNNAIKLEPNNPIFVTALGRSHILNGDFLSRSNNRDGQTKEYLEGAKTLEKAIAVKYDYVPAQFLLAQLYDKQNRSNQASAKANEILQIAGNDPAVAYQVGLLHFVAGRFENARSVFEQAVQLFPNYSNARYYLGLLYERQNQRAKAIEQFQIVSDLNPENGEVKTILKNLRSNKSALSGGLTPTTPAPANEPPVPSEKTPPKTETRPSLIQ